MAPSVGDILQVIDAQSYLGETILNVYFYELTAVGSLTTYQTIADNFQGDVIEVVKAHQNSALTHTRTTIKNLTNGVDIFEEPIAVAGLYGDAPAPSLLAFSFRLVRTTAVTRHGSKRFAGVGENMIGGNSAEAVIGPQLAATAVAIGSPVNEEGGAESNFSMRPVIVGRTLAIVDGKETWPLDLTKINPVASAQYIRLSSQVSRRVGRGV